MIAETWLRGKLLPAGISIGLWIAAVLLLVLPWLLPTVLPGRGTASRQVLE